MSIYADTPTLFLYRSDAIDTSIDAAESIDVTRLEQLVFDAIRNAGADGMTQQELLNMFPHLSYSSVTARPAALKHKGLVVDSGRRRAGQSSRSQSVLVAAEFAEGAS